MRIHSFPFQDFDLTPIEMIPTVKNRLFIPYLVNLKTSANSVIDRKPSPSKQKREKKKTKGKTNEKKEQKTNERDKE